MVDFLASHPVALCVVLGLSTSLILARTIARQRTGSGKRCPSCQAELPAARHPSDLYEIFVGGWTCPGCGTKLTHDLKKR